MLKVGFGVAVFWYAGIFSGRSVWRERLRHALIMRLFMLQLLHLPSLKQHTLARCLVELHL